MPSYSMLAIDNDEQVRATKVHLCATVANAMTEATEYLGWHPAVEIWQGERFVARLDRQGVRSAARETVASRT